METGQKHSVKTINISQQDKYKLSIQVSLNGLSFCILDTRTNCITTNYSISFNSKANPTILLDKLKNELNTNERLQLDFSSVAVIHNNELATLVPNELFTEDHLADYLKFNAAILQTDYITFDQIDELDVKNVYVPFINVNNYIFEQFGSFEYYHQHSLLLSYFVPLAFKNVESSVYINIGQDLFEMLAYENKKLTFINKFEFHSKEDFIYYVMFSLEQLELDPEKVAVYITGLHNENKELFDIAYKYIRNVSELEVHLKYDLESPLDQTSIPLSILKSL
ncbi:MAG: DUF3822 family protein [bacterium]